MKNICENYIQIIFGINNSIGNKRLLFNDFLFYFKQQVYLTKDSLVLALGAKITMEARAGTSGVVADTTARAISAGSVTQTLKRVSARGALNLRAVRATATDIANTTDVHLSIPRGGVSATSLGGELLLGEADTSLVTVVGAHGALASDTVVVGETSALTSLSVAGTLVGALGLRVSIVGTHDGTNPGSTKRASSGRAISLSPCSEGAVNTGIAFALVIATARAVTTASVGAEGSSAGQQRNKNSNNLHF